MPNPQQQTWLITGVSSGLGRALAEVALERGDRVAGTVRTEKDRIRFEQLAPERAMGVVIDVTDEMAVRCGVEALEARTGGIDVLVNNAGRGFVGAVEEASLGEIRAQFELNVLGPVSMMQAVLPFMRRRRAGRIVNITSVSGLVGWPSLGIYSGAKFALEGICETLALELADLGIRMILVEPGGLRTDFSGRSLQRAERSLPDYDSTAGSCKRILAAHAGKEPGDPRKAALAILTAVDAERPPQRLLLGSDALRYATGKLDQLQAEIERWSWLSASTDFPAA